MDCRIGSAYRAIGILAQLQLPELHSQGVKQHQAADQRIAFPYYQLDCLDRLDHSDYAGQHAKDTSFGTARHQTRRRRLGVQTSVARPLLGIENGGLSFAPEYRTVNTRLAQQHAGVVYEITGWKIIGTVNHDVVGLQDFQSIFGSQRGLVALNLHVWVDLGYPLSRRLEFRAADIFGRVDDLALQIGEINHIEIDDA